MIDLQIHRVLVFPGSEAFFHSTALRREGCWGLMSLVMMYVFLIEHT